MPHFLPSHYLSPFIAKGLSTDFAFVRRDGGNIDLQLPREVTEVLSLAGDPGISLIQVLQGGQYIALLKIAGHSNLESTNLC